MAILGGSILEPGVGQLRGGDLAAQLDGTGVATSYVGMRRCMAWRGLMLGLTVAACGGSGAVVDGATGGEIDGPSAPSVVDTQPVYLDDCQAFASRCVGPDADDPRCGACQYRAWHRGDQCTATAPCDDLFVYWAAFDCARPELEAVVADLLVTHPRTVMLCVQPIFPGEILPSSLGAPERDQRVMSAALARLRPAGDLGVWSGANLVHGGCSMGATRYPVVAARYPDEATWLGSGKNAVCMSDGVIDVRAQDAFVGEGTGSSCAGRHRRVASSYTQLTPTPGHDCTASPGGQCACDPAHAAVSYPGDCAEGDCVEFDSIVVGAGFASGVSAANFAVPNWRLITEGDNWEADLANRCERDVVPAAPFTALCSLLDADPDHACTVTHLADAPHCSTYNANLGALCLDWFAALP